MARDFSSRYPLGSANGGAALTRALACFQPDAVYVHKCSDPSVLEVLTKGNLPVVRMVHDHDLYCMRGYKYGYFSRQICQRAASAYCVSPAGRRSPVRREPPCPSAG